MIDEVGEDTDRSEKAVWVEYLDLRWFYRGRKNFISFVMLLKEMPGCFYTSKFINALLGQYWEETQRRIFKYQFLPFVAQFILSVAYFRYALAADSKGSVVEKILGATSLILLCLAARIEVKQFFSLENKLDYFKEAFNWLDMSGLLFSLIVLLLTIFDLDWIKIETLRVLAAIASFSLANKFYDWLRLFDETSFFILLIG